MSALTDCIAGRISPPVAVARLLLAGHDPAAILSLLDEAQQNDAVLTMRSLVTTRREGLQALSAEVAETMAGHDASGPTPEEGIAGIAAFFDRAVRHSPEASVALYSLGDPAILAAATAEIMDWLRREALVGAEMDVLDLGCGIGRICTALAPLCRTVLGLDVSAGMVEEAGRRLATWSNVEIRHTSGQGLNELPAASLDLVLAIDSFPYIVQAGLAATHVNDAARLLRPGGALCILNLSYRGDDAQDQADVARWAREAGLQVQVAGKRPFELWDGTATVLRQGSTPAP